MNPNLAISPQELSLEQELSELIQQLRAAKQSIPIDIQLVSELESKIFTKIDTYLRMSLKPVMAKVFGPDVYREGSSVQFTVMLNDLFVKILGRYSEEALRMETARDLRNWCSCALRHQMLDYVRQKKNRHQLLNDIAPMYEAQRKHFRDRFGEHFDDCLTVIECWSNGDDTMKNSYAKLLELHYVFGMTWDETCENMNVSKSTFYRLRAEAIAALKMIFDPNSSTE